MRKRGLKKAMLFVLCAILAVAGWIVWDTCLRPGGEDEFDEAFLREFDPAYIIDHMDELRKTGLFEYQIANETIINPKRLIIWPAGSDSLRSPVYILHTRKRRRLFSFLHCAQGYLGQGENSCEVLCKYSRRA